jgi:hypothetical protein
MEAITQAPKNQQDLLKRQAERIKAELPKIRAEIANLAADTKLKHLSAQDLTNRIKAYINTDLDYLRADNYEKGGDAQSTTKYWTEWFKHQVENLVPMVGSAYIGGRALGTGMSKTTSTRTQESSSRRGNDYTGTPQVHQPIYGPNGEVVRQGYTRQFRGWSEDRTQSGTGVQDLLRSR